MYFLSFFSKKSFSIICECQKPFFSEFFYSYLSHHIKTLFEYFVSFCYFWTFFSNTRWFIINKCTCKLYMQAVLCYHVKSFTTKFLRQSNQNSMHKLRVFFQNINILQLYFTSQYFLPMFSDVSLFLKCYM